jgi:hypothetical protein
VSNIETREACLKKIEELNLLYKSKSIELVECPSLAMEIKIKEEMSRCEVQMKVLKRKLVSFELESV